MLIDLNHKVSVECRERFVDQNQVKISALCVFNNVFNSY